MSSQAPPPDPLIGRTFSQYEIVAKLGGGGMGVVYQARDTKLGRFVALKFLPAEWSHDDGAKQRFIREAQAASATLHKSLCTVHDIAETSDGRLFIVMALYEGETLKRRLERGPLPIADALDIAADLAEGLSKAHGQGVVHRDIKPGNIILTDDGAKLLDFGLAKFADTLQLTAPGSTIGTVNYMSPEQTRGEDADAQSDVWAWGVVLYEMLAGVPPFRGGYPEATFYAIRHEPLPSLRALRPDVSEALEMLVGQALDKDRADRAKSAREVARAVRWLQGRTVPLDLQTEPVPVPGRAAASAPPRRGRRRRGLAIAAGIVLLLAGVAWWRMPAAPVRIAVVPVANHTGVAALDRYRLALTESLIDELRESPTLDVVPYLRLAEMARPFMTASGDVSSRQAVQAIASASGAPLLVVPALVYRDRDASWLMAVQIRNADTGTAVAAYETAAVTSTLSEQTAFRLVTAAAERVQAHFPRRFGRAARPRAASARLATPDAARLFTDGLDAYDALEFGAAFAAFSQSAQLDPQHAMTQAWLARAAGILSRRAEAVAAATRAVQLAASGDSASETAFAEAVLAESQGDLDAAEAAMHRLAALRPGDAWGQAELADFLKRRQDRNSQAIEAYHALLRLDPSSVRPHVELCQLYTRLDDHPLAEREAQAALQRYRAAGHRGGEAQALLCLTEGQRKQGGTSLAPAREHAAEAQAIFATLDQPYNLARAYNYQGLVEYSAGRLTEASAAFREAVTRLRAEGNRALEGVALMNLGAISFQLGLPTPALDFFRQGRELFFDIGDERRAAEADVNIVGVQVEYGVDPADTLRLSTTARATLERLELVEFQLLALQNEAETHRHAGRLARARTLLRSAQEMARSRGLAANLDTLSLTLSQADVQASDYGAAIEALERLAGDPGRADAIEARVALGIALALAGDAAGADDLLRGALAAITEQQHLRLRPLTYWGLGLTARQRGDLAQARAAFSSAASSWADPLPNAAAIEARCALAAVDAAAGQVAAARIAVDAALADAARLHQLVVETRCRLAQAQVLLAAGRTADAAAAVAAIPDDGDDVALGSELRADVEFWRGEAMARSRAGDAGYAGDADAPRTRARALVRQVQASLPPGYRDRYVTRADIRTILSAAASR